MKEFTHLDEKGRARMVDVTEKDITLRQATARGSIRMSPVAFQRIMAGGVGEGERRGVARTAGGVAARTIYDMCKAVDREMVISDIHLVEKRGGKSGHFVRKKNSPRD